MICWILLAEGDFWTWLMKLTDKAFDPAFMASFVAAVGVLVKLYRDWDVPKNLKENNKDTKENKEAIQQVLPQVADKVDSATETLKAATDRAEKMVDTAAVKVGLVIGERVGKDATAAAVIVAQEATRKSDEMSQKVDRIAKAIHGPTDVDGEGGICVVAKVTEQGKAIEKLDDRLTKVEVAVNTGFDKILQELKVKSELESLKTTEERHNKRDAEYAAQLKAQVEKLTADITKMKETSTKVA